MSHTVKCGLCGKDIVLLKDSTEGMKIYHGACYETIQKNDEERD